MLLSEPLASLITFFMTSLIKFHRNSQQISDSFYHITESSDLEKTVKTYSFGNVGQPCLGLVGYFCSFVVATGCPSERRPPEDDSCYGG